MLLQYILPTIYLVQREMGILHVWPPLLQLCNLPQLYIHKFRYLESDENQVLQNQDFAALIPGPKKFIQAKSLCIRDSYQFKLKISVATQWNIASTLVVVRRRFCFLRFFPLQSSWQYPHSFATCLPRLFVFVEHQKLPGSEWSVHDR